MQSLDIFISLAPFIIGFITLVIVLAKMHADLETIKEKIKVLFELWNNRNN